MAKEVHFEIILKNYEISEFTVDISTKIIIFLSCLYFTTFVLFYTSVSPQLPLQHFYANKGSNTTQLEHDVEENLNRCRNSKLLL